VLDFLLHFSTTLNIKAESYHLKEEHNAGLLGRPCPALEVEPEEVSIAPSQLTLVPIDNDLDYPFSPFWMGRKKNKSGRDISVPNCRGFVPIRSLSSVVLLSMQAARYYHSHFRLHVNWEKFNIQHQMLKNPERMSAGFLID